MYGTRGCAHNHYHRKLWYLFLYQPGRQKLLNFLGLVRVDYLYVIYFILCFCFLTHGFCYCCRRARWGWDRPTRRRGCRSSATTASTWRSRPPPTWASRPTSWTPRGRVSTLHPPTRDGKDCGPPQVRVGGGSRCDGLWVWRYLRDRRSPGSTVTRGMCRGGG